MEASAAKQASFSIHVENRYASGKLKRPRGPRSSLTMFRPEFDLQTKALAYYLQYHHLQYHVEPMTNVLNISGGLSECVTAWQASGRTCPMVELALSSIALAIFSRTQRHSEAAMRASTRYCHLLRVAQQRIMQVGVPNPDVQAIDACLLAISLMGRYEAVRPHPGNIKSKKLFRSLRSWSHHDGVMAILKCWNDNTAHDTATYIIKRTRRELIKSSFLRMVRLPNWMQDGAEFGESGQELNYDRLIIRIQNLYSATSSLPLYDIQQRFTTTENLTEEAQKLDRELQEWAAELPSTYSYERCALLGPGSYPRKHFYSATLYNYPSLRCAAVWCEYFAARILLNSIRLTLLEVHHSDPLLSYIYMEQRQSCIAELKDMADSLASTIPFCLEKFEVIRSDSPIQQITIEINAYKDNKPYLATLVVWALTIASSRGGVDLQQRLWFKSELAELGRITGEGILECADTDEWPLL